MADITFFHNERVDEARRTGLTVGGVRALDHYVEGSEERDPSLRWYVDVIFHTPAVPADAGAWVAAHAGAIWDALTDAADRLAAGVDADGVPWSFERPGADGPVRVSVSALRSETGHAVGGKLRRLVAGDLKSFLGSIQPAAAGAVAYG